MLSIRVNSTVFHKNWQINNAEGRVIYYIIIVDPRRWDFDKHLNIATMVMQYYDFKNWIELLLISLFSVQCDL